MANQRRKAVAIISGGHAEECATSDEAEQGGVVIESADVGECECVSQHAANGDDPGIVGGSALRAMPVQSLGQSGDEFELLVDLATEGRGVGKGGRDEFVQRMGGRIGKAVSRKCGHKRMIGRAMAGNYEGDVKPFWKAVRSSG